VDIVVNVGLGLEILLLNPFDPLPTAPDGVEAPPPPTFTVNDEQRGKLPANGLLMMIHPDLIPPAPPPAPMPAPPEPPPATTRYGRIIVPGIIYDNVPGLVNVCIV
jgi:hypothetical protein